MSATTATRPSGPEWFGQPRGLTVLFLTEMWEIFSYYGMRALLVLYMTKALHFPAAKAALVYGGYTAAVYFTPIVGGLVADRVLGARRAVLLGGATMAAGHFMLASPALFYPALAAIALGNGLFLPALPSQVPALFAPDDPRRGSAFNVYYVGINIGAFLAPLVCGTLGETLGWHWGFGAAGVGMLVALVVYLAGGRWLAPEPPRLSRTHVRTRMDGRVLWLLAGVWLGVTVFRGAYEQIGSTIALWADGAVDRSAPGGFVIPASWFQAVDPLCVFLFTPPLVRGWTRAAARGREPSALGKMVRGAGGVALAFALLAGVAGLQPRPGWPWLAAFVVLYAAAELFILPVGLGLFARVAPEGWGGTLVAAWFFAAFTGNLLAGALGALWPRMTPATFFLLMAGVAAGSAAVLAILASRQGRAAQA